MGRGEWGQVFYARGEWGGEWGRRRMGTGLLCCARGWLEENGDRSSMLRARLVTGIREVVGYGNGLGIEELAVGGAFSPAVG